VEKTKMIWPLFVDLYQGQNNIQEYFLSM
jgi:hypothetical protein